MGELAIFGNFMESNEDILPKHNFLLMTCFISMQKNKKSGSREVFVSKDQTELINHSFPELFPGFA
jgi:hypothetical protein